MFQLKPPDVFFLAFFYPNRTDLYLFIIRTIDPHWFAHFDPQINYSLTKIQRNLNFEPLPRVPGLTKKNSFLETGPRFISYRLSHKRAKLVNLLKTGSCDRRTEKVRTVAYWKYAKKTKHKLWLQWISVMKGQLARFTKYFILRWKLCL
jgi:hypothetical protein